MTYKEPARRKITVPIAQAQRRAPRQPTSARPEWLNSALVDTAIVIGTTLATTLLLLLISGQIQDTTGANLISRAAAPAPALLPSPTAEPSLLLQHPSPTPPPGKSVKMPAPTLEALESSSDDAEIQGTIDRRLQDDPDLSALNVTATVAGGTVTLTGRVESDELKTRIEKLVRAVKGVKQVDSKIAVVSND